MAGREEGKLAAAFQSVWTDAVWSDKESVVKGVNSYESGNEPAGSPGTISACCNVHQVL